MGLRDDELQESLQKVERLAGVVDSAVAAFGVLRASEANLRQQLEEAAGGLTDEQKALFDAHQAQIDGMTEKLAAAIAAPGGEPPAPENPANEENPNPTE